MTAYCRINMVKCHGAAIILCYSAYWRKTLWGSRLIVYFKGGGAVSHHIDGIEIEKNLQMFACRMFQGVKVDIPGQLPNIAFK